MRRTNGQKIRFENGTNMRKAQGSLQFTWETKFPKHLVGLGQCFVRVQIHRSQCGRVDIKARMGARTGSNGILQRLQHSCRILRALLSWEWPVRLVDLNKAGRNQYPQASAGSIPEM